MRNTEKREYRLIDRRRGKVFVLTQWAEYLLYAYGAQLLEFTEEDIKNCLECVGATEECNADDIRALIEFAQLNHDKYAIFNGDMERVIELENGRYALADDEYLGDWWSEERDVPFLEDYSGAKYARVCLPSVLCFARRKNSIGR